jgi:hypothetical protein
MTETVIDHAGPYARRVAVNIAKLPPALTISLGYQDLRSRMT